MVHPDIQAELFVPLEHASAALQAVWDATKEWSWGVELNDDGEIAWGNLAYGCQIRSVKGDDGWLSPHPVDSLAVHFSFNAKPECYPEVVEAVSVLEAALQPFRARPHWGKLAPLTFAPDSVKSLFGDGLQRFRLLCEEHDPEGKFRNGHVAQMLFGDCSKLGGA
jgi:xylitol oxidase